MPYIVKEDRSLYIPHLNKILTIFQDCHGQAVKEERVNNPFLLGELFEYYIKRLFYSLLVAPPKEEDVIVAYKFPEFSRNYSTLTGMAYSVVSEIIEISNKLKAKGTLDKLGDLNYSITYVYWRILEWKGNYSYRVYLKSIIEKMISYIDDNEGKRVDPIEKDLYKSVLSDVILETYRRSTAPYEDEKIEENGDV